MRWVARELTHMTKARGMTHGELAKKLGMSRQRVSHILSGKEEVRLGTIVQVARALGAGASMEFRWKRK